MARNQANHRSWPLPSLLLPLLLPCCMDSGGREDAETAEAQSCMTCHNGSQKNDYAGPGLENPHPFPGADPMSCTTCHGGNGAGKEKLDSHVPPPPEIGDRQNLTDDAHAYFNRRTLAGMDKFADYQVNGVTWTALDYLQFVNPGDVRVASQGRGCGGCHVAHADQVSRNLLATSAGILSGATYAIGADNVIPAHQGLYDDTAADLGFRAVSNPSYVFDPANVGAVGSLVEQPVFAGFGKTGPMEIFKNPAFDAFDLVNDLNADRSVKSGSRLSALYQEQVAFTCGDCHLGSAGANNRYGDFRSAGCTACHMPYSLDGRSGSRDPNVLKNEPLNPDAIAAPETAHVKAHRIRSTAKTLSNGAEVEGIEDITCAGCHQGSNRTVMQYWGIRLDQNQDLRNHVQYPANPVSFKNTADNPILFDPAIGNNTFNGRNANQYIEFEDYDGDDRDDTPADVHYDAGMGCIDCHGSFEMHGGDVKDPNFRRIGSRMEHQLTIQCENCHGNAAAYATTSPGIAAHDGRLSELAVDRSGRVLDHVVRESDGNYYLYSRLTGKRHFVSQTRDAVVDTGRLNPFTLQPVYSARASYAMGRADADPSNGIGPLQQGRAPNNFSHGDRMDCATCHSSWSNTCVGCHLKGEYNTGNNFSNITGERIVYRQTNADFTYLSPIPFQLGVSASNRIAVFGANTKVFYQYRDLNRNFSPVFAFTDRNGGGNNPASVFGSLGHNSLTAHSIRGRVESTKEGPRYCVACHLTTEGLANFGTEYDAFRTAMATRNYAALDFTLLKQHIGKNPGNELDSPLFVHMVAGLGSGVYTFDQSGAAVNPIDTNANRVGSNGVAPATNYDPANISLDLDRIVEANGMATGSNNHSMLVPGGLSLRDGSADPTRPGPLGMTLIQALTDPVNGIILDSWINADGELRGFAPDYVQDP